MSKTIFQGVKTYFSTQLTLLSTVLPWSDRRLIAYCHHLFIKVPVPALRRTDEEAIKTEQPKPREAATYVGQRRRRQARRGKRAAYHSCEGSGELLFVCLVEVWSVCGLTRRGLVVRLLPSAISGGDGGGVLLLTVVDSSRAASLPTLPVDTAMSLSSDWTFVNTYGCCVVGPAETSDGLSRHLDGVVEMVGGWLAGCLTTSRRILISIEIVWCSVEWGSSRLGDLYHNVNPSTLTHHVLSTSVTTHHPRVAPTSQQLTSLSHPSRMEKKLTSKSKRQPK